VRPLPLLAAALLGLQLVLGAFTIWSRRAVLPTTAHLAVGAALLATCLVLALHAAHAAPADAAVSQPVDLGQRAVA